MSTMNIFRLLGMLTSVASQLSLPEQAQQSSCWASTPRNLMLMGNSCRRGLVPPHIDLDLAPEDEVDKRTSLILLHDLS